MLHNTTKLNTPGPELAELTGVHALTDVTGFGLAGHALEIARGANLTAQIKWADVPLLPGVVDLIKAGMVTGASGRNWDGYGQDVSLAAGLPAECQTLMTDPQTSGGLLVCCAPEAVQDVLAIFKKHDFEHASVIGHIGAKQAARLVVV
jgi:selenide,water dikinase